MTIKRPSSTFYKVRPANEEGVRYEISDVPGRELVKISTSEKLKFQIFAELSSKMLFQFLLTVKFSILIVKNRYTRTNYYHRSNVRGSIVPSVLNHSTLEFRDFSKRAPGSWIYDKSTYFWTLIPNHPTWRRVKMLPWQVILIGKKLHRSRDITWHGHLREKVKFLFSVMVVVRIRVEC